MVKMYQCLSMVVAASAREDAEAMLQVSKFAADDQWKWAVKKKYQPIRIVKGQYQPIKKRIPFRWSPGWFVAEVADLKNDAAVLAADSASCNKLTPSRALPHAAHLAHNICRDEQLAMLGLNSGTDCEESKKKDCDVLQSQFEQVVCAHGKSCKAVEACHKGVADAFVELKELEAEHKEMFVTATKEDCGREHRRGTDEQKAACAALQPDTSHLSITYASEPDVACTEYRVIPGSPGWITEEYSHHKWSQLAVAVTSCAEDHGIEQISAGPPTTYR